MESMVGGDVSRINSAVHVIYTVQKGDTLSELLEKTLMTKKNYVALNGNSNPETKLKAGEKIIITDPLESCHKKYRDGYEALLEQGTTIASNVDHCEDNTQYGPFKPLQKYTEKLKVESKEEETNSYPYGSTGHHGLECTL